MLGDESGLTSFGCSDGLREGFYTALDGGVDAMLLECAKSWLVRMGSGRLPSLVLSDEFGSLGTNTNYDSYWGTPLGVTDRGRGKFILVCRLLGGGL
ncbi:hypothetical protein DEO72_LG9g1997 [Vigna unguiculata]|uniref:Uncharacterized protein n=1 Tax=Vigna unguiculata TaxID=3917 RepID=A0A4D6N200_VIGUN|nr:hypothetical protein DEO72_LG9g1997 [Vigna unguiculata]